MKNKEKFFFCVFFIFFSSYGSELPIEFRLQNYLGLINQMCGADSTNYSKQATILLKAALGIMKGDDFSPDEEVVLYLLRNSYLNPLFKDPHTGGTCLHFAAFYGASEVMRYLLHEAHIPIELDREGKTPLHWAIAPYHKTPRRDVIEMLLEAKKDLVKTRDLYGKTPLFYLTSFSEMGDFLLSLGIDINERDSYGRTTLFIVKNQEDTRYLCSRGIDVNKADERKLTALGAYLTTYSSRCNVVKREQNHHAKIDDLKNGIRTLVYYGAHIPCVYHPASETTFSYELDSLKEEKIRRIRVLQTVFGNILRHMEETLELTRTRLALCKKNKKMETVSPLLVVDTYCSALPFFKKRYREMKEIIAREKKIKGSKEDIPDDSEFGDFLSRLSFSKQISSTLHYMACDLVYNHEEYAVAQGLPENERIEMGKSILRRLFPSEYPEIN